MTAPSEDDFNQFLDMSGMANIPDGMHFDFQGFQDGAPASQSLMAHQRDPADSLMTDSESSSMMPRTGTLMQNETSPMTTSAAHNSVPAHMLPDPSSSDITSIDAQIQYLQQQKFHQQQRQLHEQRAAFFSTNHNHGHSHSHSVPPTPQSIEMPPGSGQFYSQAEQVSGHGAFDRSYQQQLRDQQDVSYRASCHSPSRPRQRLT